MTYIHKIAVALSSNLAPRYSFFAFTLCQLQYRGVSVDNLMRTRIPPRAFTLIEFLIVAAIITILAALAVPALTAVLERAKATKDLSNLRQIGLATQLYMNDNSGVLFSTTGSWMSGLYNADTPPPTPKYLSSC